MNKDMKQKTKISVEIKMLISFLFTPVPFLLIIYKLFPELLVVENVLQGDKIVEYYIELLAALGATFLGIIATMQNQRLQKLEESSYKISSSCNISVRANYNKSDWKLTNDNVPKYEQSNRYIDVYFQNYSEAFLKQVIIYFGEEKFNSYLTLANGEKKSCKIILPKKEDSYLNKKCRIEFISCYDVITHGDFKIVEDKKSKKEDENRMIISHYHFYGIKPSN